MDRTAGRSFTWFLGGTKNENKGSQKCGSQAVSFVLLLNPSAKTTALVDGAAATRWPRETPVDSDGNSAFGWLISWHPLVLASRVLEAVDSYTACSCCLLATTYLTIVTVWPSHVMKGSLTGAPFLHLFLALSPYPFISPSVHLLIPLFLHPSFLPVSHISLHQTPLKSSVSWGEFVSSVSPFKKLLEKTFCRIKMSLSWLSCVLSSVCREEWEYR